MTMRWAYLESEGDWGYTIILGVLFLILYFCFLYIRFIFISKARRRRFIKELKEELEEKENKRLEKKLAKRAKFWDTWYNGPSFMDHFKDEDPWRY